MEKFKRHQIFWKIIRFIAPSVLKPLYKYSYELAPKLEPPSLVFSNHFYFFYYLDKCKKT